MDPGQGAGPAPEKGSIRFTLRVAGGFGFEGGHAETKGLSPDGRVISVPLHRHEVSLDYWRTELEVEYAFHRSWDVVFRLPFDFKSQTAGVTFVDPAGPEERDAALRNRDIHHRTESYRGIGDVGVLLAHRRISVFRDGDFLKLAIGATLPAGDTEDNPYLLGEQGATHLHIQFGTGTVDPNLELYYRTPIDERVSLGTFAFGRLSLYENGRSFRGPTEWTAGWNVNCRVASRWTLHGNVTWFRQGFARWGSERDINTGLSAWSGLLGATFRLNAHASAGLDLRLPISQSTFSPDGDSFRHGPTLMLRISLR